VSHLRLEPTVPAAGFSLKRSQRRMGATDLRYMRVVRWPCADPWQPRSLRHLGWGRMSAARGGLRDPKCTFAV